jgi:hypothetical protein
MSSDGKARFSNPNCKRDCIKRVTEKIDIKYYDTIASAYEQCQKAACLGYVNPQDIANWQLFREQHEWLGAVKVKLGLNSEAKDLNFQIPAEYHQCLDVFGERIADALPPHRTFDRAIDLKDGTDPRWGPISALSAGELKALHEYLDEMLRTGKIWQRKSPAGAPIQSWQIPQSLRDVQSFLGFANFYRRFINGFSRICCPSTESTKGDKKSWKWTLEMNKAFDELKKRF